MDVGLRSDGTVGNSCNPSRRRVIRTCVSDDYAIIKYLRSGWMMNVPGLWACVPDRRNLIWTSVSQFKIGRLQM
jgi:hypothetical protein